MPNARTLYMRGKHAELELCKLLWKAGYAVMRAPGSGRKARRVKPPDVLAVKRCGDQVRVLVFEVKYREKPMTIYLSPTTIKTLMEYARRTGGEAYIAVKIREWGEFKAIPIDEVEECELNARRMYRITVQKMREARSVKEVIHSGT